MRKTFDRRVIPDFVLDFVRECQGRIPCHLGGGAALAGASEPRDLVDLYFLDQAGFPPEEDLENASRKDAGIDPGVLAWLLAQFPTRPLPAMLEPLTSSQLETFRNELAERLRRILIE